MLGFAAPQPARGWTPCRPACNMLAPCRARTGGGQPGEVPPRDREVNVRWGEHVDDGWSRLGGAIRERRLRRSLSLVGLAALAELSQPFLSQIENGRARPSLLSLRRIAEALDTTPQALFEGPLHAPQEPTIVRARDVQSIDIAGSDGGGSCRLLLAGDAPVHLVEFDGLPSRLSRPVRARRLRGHPRRRRGGGGGGRAGS